MANEADVLSAETKYCTVQSTRGGTPLSFRRPKRKRGYHRALKRGEVWARVVEAERRLREDFALKLYSHADMLDGQAYLLTRWDYTGLRKFLENK